MVKFDYNMASPFPVYSPQNALQMELVLAVYGALQAAVTDYFYVKRNRLGKLFQVLVFLSPTWRQHFDSIPQDFDSIPQDTHLKRRMQMELVLSMEHSGLVQLIEADKRDDLARVYRLLRRIGQDGLLFLKRGLHDHVKKVGLVRRPLRHPQCVRTNGPGKIYRTFC